MIHWTMQSTIREIHTKKTFFRNAKIVINIKWMQCMLKLISRPWFGCEYYTTQPSWHSWIRRLKTNFYHNPSCCKSNCSSFPNIIGAILHRVALLMALLQRMSDARASLQKPRPDGRSSWPMPSRILDFRHRRRLCHCHCSFDFGTIIKGVAF